MLLSVVVAIIAFALASGLAVDPDRYFRHITYLRGLLDLVSSGDTPVAAAFTFSASGTAGYLRTMMDYWLSALGLPAVIAFGVGLAGLLYRRNMWWLLVPALTYVLYLTMTYRLAQMRYLMPVIVLSVMIAAAGLIGSIRATRHWLRVLGIALIVVVVGQASARWLDLIITLRTDQRWAAADWLAPRLEPGMTVSYFGSAQKLPPLPAGIRTSIAAPDVGMYRWPRIDEVAVGEILASWDSVEPEFIIVMPDHTSRAGMPYPHSLPPRLFARLKAGTVPGYRQAIVFPGRKRSGWLSVPELDYPVLGPPIEIYQRHPSD